MDILLLCMSVHHVHAVPMANQSSVTIVIDGCKPVYGL